MCPADFASHESEHREPERSTTPVRRIAAPMVVGHADDRAEHDADRVAHEVVARLSSGESGESHVHDGCHGIARVAAPSTGSPEVGREGGAISEDLTSRIEARRGTGSALPTAVRRRMESGFGRSLADVRVHTDGESASLNRAVSARAFTTGKDIFFGAGEYSPGTAAGEKVLAHEIAHTQQGGGGARRLHRLWNLDAPTVDYTAAQSIGTIDSGQAIYILDDGGDKIVVKTEESPIGLGKLSEAMHNNLSNAKSVKHRKLSTGDATQVKQMVMNDTAKYDRRQWTKLGAAKRSDRYLQKDFAKFFGMQPGDDMSAVSDFDFGHAFHNIYLTEGPVKNAPWMAMSHASGVRAQEASSTPDDRNRVANKPQEGNLMRGFLRDHKHMRALGRLTAVDLFMGNSDRIVMGNVGNWFYDPQSAAVTVIDHVDGTVPLGFKKMPTTKELATFLRHLDRKNLDKTATDTVNGLLTGIADKGGDKDVVKWVDEQGYLRGMMEEALVEGMKEGKALLVKTFGATRFTVGGSGARQTKKSIKSAAREGVATDGGVDPDLYYKILKARAAWLKSN